MTDETDEERALEHVLGCQGKGLIEGSPVCYIVLMFITLVGMAYKS